MAATNTGTSAAGVHVSLGFQLLVLCVALNLVACDTTVTVLYVKADNGRCICPQGNADHHKCHPLNYYTQNITKFFTSNTKMIFLCGVHRLNETLTISSIHNFEMVGSKAANMDAGVPKPSSFIDCQNGGNGLQFTNSTNVSLEGIQLNSCGALIKLEDTFLIQTALCFDKTGDVSLIKVVTDNTKGFGVQFDNSYGDIKVLNSSFAHSISSAKNEYGGNARFWFGHGSQRYHDKCPTSPTHLVIDSSWFLYGQDNDKYVNQHNSAGLTLIIECPLVYISINNVTAEHNIGKDGGNIAISWTHFFENSSRIAITNSHINHGSANIGGGLKIWFYYNNLSPRNTCNYGEHEVITVENSEFRANKASTSSGAVYIGHYESNFTDCNICQVVFKDCIFDSNYVVNDSWFVARGGAVMEVVKLYLGVTGYMIHTTPQFELQLLRCNISNNCFHEYKTKEGAIMEIIGTGKVTMTDCQFTQNKGTALSLRGTNVIIKGSNLFKSNQAAYGGALKFSDSSLLFLIDKSTIHFIGNHAEYTGGAIYAEQPSIDKAPACFFQLVLPNKFPVEDLQNTTHLVFENNSASIAGDAIYGGVVEDCYTLNWFKKGKRLGKYYSKDIFEKITDLNGQSVSSNPYGVCFCNSTSNEKNCSMKDLNYTIGVYPGQTFQVSVVAVGQRDGSSPATINATLHDQASNHTLVEKSTPKPQVNCSVIKYSLHSNRSNATISFSPQILTSSDLRIVHLYFVQPSITVSIQPCPWGFELTQSPPYKCDCDPLMQNYTSFPVQCDINEQSIHFHQDSDLWVGQQVMNGNAEMIVTQHCDPQYCNRTSRNISQSTIDHQCRSDHTGVMCKSCNSSEYSLALGTSNCLKDCSNKNAAWILILCFLSGILLVVVLSACNLTVTEGTINGLIFYANVLHYNHDIFFPKNTVADNFFRIFIAWLNLDFGFEVCFYKHLNAYQKVWLQFGFVLYIWIVQWFIVILSRNFIFFTRLVGRNVVKVMATLFLLCYAKVLRYSIFSLQFARVYGPQSYTVVWFHDGSVEYLRNKHILLFMAGIFLILLLAFFTLVLLFIQFLQKQTEYRCLRWINRLRPFFDANTGSCKDHYRFWPGLLYFMRALLYILYSIAVLFNSQRIAATISGTVGVCIMILTIACVSPRGVYKKWPLNILEFSFFLNLGITCILMTWKGTQKYAAYVSVSIVMMTFIGILIYHAFKQLKNSAAGRVVLARRIHYWNQNTAYIQDDDVAHHQNATVNEQTPLLRGEMPPVNHFDHLRESLLEDHED